MKRALLTGVTGQDGAYLTQLLLEKGYAVFGLVPHRSGESFERLEYLGVRERIETLPGDLTDLSSLIRALEAARPDEVYNLGARSFVGTSWAQPVSTALATGLGCLNLLEAVRIVKPDAKFYQASTSEMFGQNGQVAQRENSPFHPRSPYAVAKVFAHWSTVNYRESFGMFACCGILFNHESPLRGREYVSRKISDGAARIALGQQETLSLGNLEARRDWGFAGDYVEGIWRILQRDTPGDFVLATGKTHSVEDFCRIAFDRVGLDFRRYVVSRPEEFRPADVDELSGDPRQAKEKLGWSAGTGFEELIRMMVDADLARAEPKTSLAGTKVKRAALREVKKWASNK